MLCSYNDLISQKYIWVINAIFVLKKTGMPARFLLVGASQYEPCLFFASFSIELNEVGTSIKKPFSLILCVYIENMLVSRKT